MLNKIKRWIHKKLNGLQVKKFEIIDGYLTIQERELITVPSHFLPKGEEIKPFYITNNKRLFKLYTVPSIHFHVERS